MEGWKDGRLEGWKIGRVKPKALTVPNPTFQYSNVPERFLLKKN